jgi:predicted nucleic acid-binding protein
MAMMAANRLFLDTNVLVYLCIQTAPFYTVTRAVLDQARQNKFELWISRQVMREYLATVTRSQSFMAPLPIAAALGDVNRFLAAFHIAEDGPTVTPELVSLLGSVPCLGKQIHDANIVATMMAHGIPNILTNNIADFSRFAAFINVIPLIPALSPGGPTSTGSPPPGVP